METYELEKQVYNAMICNEKLTALLPNGALSIFHYVIPSLKNYPAIVYSAISDVPSLAGDNCEITHRVTIRIHVVANYRKMAAEEEKFNLVGKLVREIMTDLGFIRRQTTCLADDGKEIMILDFIKGV